ncbi:unnamed protein product, partial [Effrenium voratum]
MSFQERSRSDLEPVALVPGISRQLSRRPAPAKFQDLPAGLAPVSDHEVSQRRRQEDEWRSLLVRQRRAEQRLGELMELEEERRTAIMELRQDVRALGKAVALLQDQVVCAGKPVESQRLDVHSFRLTALSNAVRRLQKMQATARCEAPVLRRAMASWSQLIHPKAKDRLEVAQEESQEARLVELVESLEGQATAVQDLSELVRAELKGNREDECREQAFRELAARVEVLEERSRWPLREARELEQRSLEAMDQ